VQALQIVGNTLYIGGSFANGAGIPSADFLLACDLTTGAPRSTVPSETGAFTGGIAALTADGNGVLYAGGSFSNLTGIPAADEVAAYSGGTWHAMGSVPGPAAGAVQGGRVRSLAASGTDVYVAADAINIDNIPQADHIAKWNGSAWSAMGANTAGTNGWFDSYAFIYSMVTSGPLVFVAGSFQNANGIAAADDIAYFDGHKWRPLGSDGAGNGPLNADVSALAIYGSGLCAGGSFTNVGGDGLADFVAWHTFYRPDARIGDHPAGHFVGNNVYDFWAAGESMTVSLQRGQSRTLYVDFQNDGLKEDEFVIDHEAGSHGFTVTYFWEGYPLGELPFVVGPVAPHAHVQLKMVIKASVSATTFDGFVRVKSNKATNFYLWDAVEVIVHATAP
jgi:hypothetical protein